MFEKKRGKRFLASVMALVMILSLAPVGTLAAENEDQQENTAVTQPAVEDENQKAVADEDNDTPTPQPTEDTDSAEATKPESDLDLDIDEGFSADADTSNNDNDIVMHWNGPGNGGNNSTNLDNRFYNAKYFVLMPSKGTPTSGENQGVKNYFPNASDNGGVQLQLSNNLTGYKGKISASIIEDHPDANKKDGYFVANGVDDKYLAVPSNLGYFSEGYKGTFPSALGDNFSMQGKQIIWYVVKNEGTKWIPDYHVDGYLAGIPVELRYHENFDFNGADGTIDTIGTVNKNGENDLLSGDTVTISGINEDITIKHPGWKFVGWTENRDGSGTGYQAGDTKVMMDSCDLYAQWEAKEYKVTYTDGEGGKVFPNVEKTGTYGEAIPNYNDENTDPTRSGYTFKGWTSSVSGITPNSVMPDRDVTFTATWEEKQTTEPENPTSEINAKYFVLTPSMTAPTDGSSQGVGNYFPNDSDCGGVEGKTTSTGYPGKIKSILLSEYPTADTESGYANTISGIDGKYLEVPAEMGYFSKKNYENGEYKGYNKEKFPDVLKNLRGENQKFDMKNYQIVWYVVKKESDGYHVDGYLKGVSIQLKYIDTFGGMNREVSSVSNLESGDTVTIQGQDIIPGDHTGWIFEGWTTNADGTGKLYEAGEKETLITSTNLYAKWTASYKVVTHFMDANGIERKDLRQNSNDLTGTHGKLLSELVVQPDMKNITGTYVYVPSETSYSVDGVDKGKVGNATYTKANTVIHQYYYLDETGTIGKDGENKPTDESDGIPDAWQHKVTFQVVNGNWNVSKNNMNIVLYVNAKDKDGNTLESKLTASQIPAVGSEPNSGYEASGNWNKTPSDGLVIDVDTTFTFTYSKRSSSGGSSRPSTPPTVEIPDDVPTGLNGKDHYAYIIGYGNNDVRPQNNITRAEVATIFFRLLTDETREANMTKSNGYNDVKDGDWFCCAVSTLSKMGIIKGYEDGSFKPNDPISRAEFAAIAARFDPDGDKTPATFADVTSHWAKDEISIAANHGWIKGYEDGSFKPDQKITRAETMTLVNRVLNRLPETKDDLHKDMKTWVDNMDETAWYYLAVQEATNSHYFKNKTGTKFEQWTDLRDTRDWSELEK